MKEKELPKHYSNLGKAHKQYMEALQNLGETIKKESPLDEKTCELIQLAGAAAIRSEGAVHSHTRRAIAAGAKSEEIYHTLILLTSTIGFPTTSAALSWADDVLGK